MTMAGSPPGPHPGAGSPAPGTTRARTGDGGSVVGIGDTGSAPRGETGSVWRRHQLTDHGSKPAEPFAEHSLDWSQILQAGSAPARTRATPPVTALGVVVIVIAVAALGIGWLTGWSEFTVAGVAAAVLVAVSAIFLVGRSSYAVSIDLHDARVVAGVRATGAIVVRNNGSRRLLPVRLELPVGPTTSSFRVPSLAPNAVHEELFVIPTARRAVIDVGPALSVRGDPVGLVRRQVRWTTVDQLFVHPRTTPLHGASTGSVKDLEGSPTTELSSNDVSFHALREYAPGDDRRYVHWKTSARTWMQNQKLMVRQFEETRRTHLAVALSVDPQEYLSLEQFEVAVGMAASLGVQAFREERPVTLYGGRSALLATSARRMLDAVAGLLPEPGSGVLTAGRAAGTAVPNASVGVLITGSVPDAAQIRRAATGFAAGVRVIGIRVGTGRGIKLGAIGGVDIATVGALDDLPTALRRMRAS